MRCELGRSEFFLFHFKFLANLKFGCKHCDSHDTTRWVVCWGRFFGDYTLFFLFFFFFFFWGVFFIVAIFFFEFFLQWDLCSLQCCFWCSAEQYLISSQPLHMSKRTWYSSASQNAHFSRKNNNKQLKQHA